MNEFSYSNLQTLIMHSDSLSPKVYGEVSEVLKDKPIFNISIKNLPNLSIDIAKLGLHYPTLRNIVFFKCNILGTVQDFVAAARTKSVTGEISSSAGEWRIDDATTVYIRTNGKIIWTSNSITIQASSGDIVINS